MSSLLRTTASWWQLGPPARGHAAAALGWLAAAHMALRLTGHASARRMILRVRPSARRSSFTAAECEAAVRRAAIVFPESSCLARAIAAACLLRRAGRASVLTIGVRLADEAARPLDAHAWLESEGRIVTGARDAGTYETLLRDAIPAAP